MAKAERDLEMERMKAENKVLKRRVEKLEGALSPFACLGMGELRIGDFNRARRTLGRPGHDQ